MYGSLCGFNECILSVPLKVHIQCGSVIVQPYSLFSLLVIASTYCTLVCLWLMLSKKHDLLTPVSLMNIYLYNLMSIK